MISHSQPSALTGTEQAVLDHSTAAIRLKRAAVPALRKSAPGRKPPMIFIATAPCNRWTHIFHRTVGCSAFLKPIALFIPNALRHTHSPTQLLRATDKDPPIAPPPTARHQARHCIVFRPLNLCPIDRCRRRQTERARVCRRPHSLRVCSGDQSLVAACPVGTHGGCDAEGP